MHNSFVRKSVSVLLSLLMVLSVFGGLTITAGAATYTEGVDCAVLREGDIFTNFGKSMIMLTSCENYTIRLSAGTFYDGENAEQPKDHDVEIPQPDVMAILANADGKMMYKLGETQDYLRPYDARLGADGNAWKVTAVADGTISIRGTTVDTDGTEVPLWEDYFTTFTDYTVEASDRGSAYYVDYVAERLFDGDLSTDFSAGSSKYSHHQENEIYVEFSVPAAIVPTGYTLVTSADAEEHPWGPYLGNPAGWNLLGKRSADDDWTLIASVRDAEMSAEPNAENHFSVTEDYGVYRYFRYEVTDLATDGNTLGGCLLAELSLTGVSDGVVPIKAAAATCTKTGYLRDVFLDTNTGNYYANKACTVALDKADVEIPATGHALTYVPRVLPTIEAEGNYAYYKCEHCGKLFEDGNGAKETGLPAMTIRRSFMAQLGENTVPQMGTSFSGAAEAVCAFVAPESGWYKIALTPTELDPNNKRRLRANHSCVYEETADGLESFTVELTADEVLLFDMDDDGEGITSFDFTIAKREIETQALSLGANTITYINANGGNFVSFTPEKDGVYRFASDRLGNEDCDPEATFGNELYRDNADTAHNFSFTKALTAGETFTFVVENNWGTDCEFLLNVKMEVTPVITVKAPTCADDPGGVPTITVEPAACTVGTDTAYIILPIWETDDAAFEAGKDYECRFTLVLDATRYFFSDKVQVTDGTAQFTKNENEKEGIDVTATVTAVGHSFTNYVSNGDATCTENGTETAQCDNGCGETDTRPAEGSALGHNLTHVETVAPSLEADGCIAHWECTRCGKCFADEAGEQELGADDVVIPASYLAHMGENNAPVTGKNINKLDMSQCTFIAPEDGWYVISLTKSGSEWDDYREIITEHEYFWDKPADGMDRIKLWLDKDEVLQFTINSIEAGIETFGFTIALLDAQPQTLSLGGNTIHYQPEAGSMLVSFTPETDGVYWFISDNQDNEDCDPAAMFGIEEYDDIDGQNNCNFSFKKELTAGETFIFLINNYEEKDCEFLLYAKQEITPVVTVEAPKCSDDPASVPNVTVETPECHLSEWEAVAPVWWDLDNGKPLTDAFAAGKEYGAYFFLETDQNCYIFSGDAESDKAIIDADVVDREDHPGLAVGLKVTAVHDFTGGAWSWNDDHTAATYTLNCKCGETVSETDTAPETVVVSPAACEADAVVKYTAKVTVNGEELTDETEAITLPDTATGHNYGEPAWTWSADHSKATATFTCEKGDDAFTLDDAAPVKTEVSAATAKDDQVVKYTATVTFDGKTYTTETENVAVPGTATGEPDDPTPDDPTPDQPDTPDQPSQGSNICKWDNVDHGTSFWGRLVKFFHSILYFFAHLFGRR